MKNNYKKIIGIIIAVLTAVILLLQVFVNYKETGEIDTDKISEAIETVVDELNKSTTEIPNLTEIDEQTLEVQETENEAFELQGEIAYEGDAKTWSLTTENKPQLTYISQIDSRWKDYPYTSTRKS